MRAEASAAEQSSESERRQANAVDLSSLDEGRRASAEVTILPAARSVTRAAGNVEAVEENRIRGWVRDVDEDSVSERAISVFAGNRRVAQGLADIWRQDLLDADQGDGRHGFSLELDPVLFDGEEHDLVVRFDHRPCELPPFTFRIPPYARSQIDSIEAGVIGGTVQILSSNDAEEMRVEVFADDRPIVGGVCRRVAGRQYAFSLELPADIADDELHVFHCRLSGRATVSEPLATRVASVRTPWKHLSQSSKRSSLGAMSRVAGLRYTAIQRQLRRCAEERFDPRELRHVMNAHDRVVEGFEGRRDFPVLTLPATDSPRVSIIVPVHNKFALTYHCAASLILTAEDIPFEVIVVDDRSTDETLDIADTIENVRVVRNETNLGFLMSCRAGAAAARGQDLLFLNNDTEVTVDWLDAMLDVKRRFAGVGAVGSKLIYPNGRLQEAGGIVWGNGKPWNIGNGGNPEAPEFNYVRQTDYLSGAALLVTREAWDAVDGFTESLAPAYYEDTDIAFKLREAGYRTFYCPGSIVVHFEGMSNGRDTNVGIKRFQEVNAPRFRSRWRHAYRHNGVEGRDLFREMDRDVDFRALVIDYATPRPDHDAGSYAAVQEITLLQELGCKVTFLPNNFAHMGQYTLDLQARGVECINAPFFASPEDFIRQRGKGYDLVYVTRYDVAEQMIPLVRKFTKARIIFNNADLHFLRELRATLAGDGLAIGDAVKTRDRELSVMREVDAVVSYNETEHAVIASHNLRSDNIFRCPWVLRDRRSSVPFRERSGIAFLGGFNHLPNREAVKHFVTDIMPLLRVADPDIRFHVYGSGVTPDIEALGGEDVIIEGFVEELSEVFETCRVFVAPLLSGAGIKGKVLESIAHGVPSVLTPIAAESTGLAHGHSAFIAEDPLAWVESIITLYRDEDVWNAMGAAAHDLVRTRYGFESGLEAMAAVMRHVQLEPAEFRDPLFADPAEFER